MAVPHCRSRRSLRRGMSVLEVFGCLSAMAGGVALGSMYLGVDVKELAYVALERASIVAPRTETCVEPTTSEAGNTPATPATGNSLTMFAAQPATPGSAPATAPPGAHAVLVSAAPASAQRAFETTAGAATADPAAAPLAPPAGFFAREDLITDQQRQVLTLAYWDAVAVAMRTEISERVPAVDAEGNWQLFDYLSGRKAGHEKAAATIAAFDARGVDDHVLAYAKKAQAWHADGARLFSRAVNLLTDAPTAQLSGPFAQSWQSASTQHRMEARLLAEKHQAVESYLSHAYAPAVEMPAPPIPPVPPAPPAL